MALPRVAKQTVWLAGLVTMGVVTTAQAQMPDFRFNDGRVERELREQRRLLEQMQLDQWSREMQRRDREQQRDYDRTLCRRNPGYSQCQ